MFDNTALPGDPYILLSYINTKLRDDYPQGLDALCEDLDVDRDALVAKLEAAGFNYDATTNRFA